MPQPKRAASGSSGSASRRSTSSRSTSRSGAAKSTSRSGSTRSSSAAKSRTTKASSSRTSKASGRATKSAGARSSSSRSRSTASTRARRSASSGDARVEAVAARLRKLNERIIDAGREAGESTLSSYEKALKAIATGIEKGPGRSDIEWISHLATAQAKFIRDVTDNWTKAARGVLK